MVVLGIIGELLIIIDGEKIELLWVVLEVVGDWVCVIVGVGIYDIVYSIWLVKVCVVEGVYGLLVVMFYYFKLL